MPINLRQNKVVLNQVKKGYDTTLNVFGRHLNKKQKMTLRKKLIEKTEIHQTPESYTKTFIQSLQKIFKLPVDTSGFAQDAKGKIQLPENEPELFAFASHEAVHELDKQGFFKYDKRTLIRRIYDELRDYDKSEHLSSAIQLFSVYLNLKIRFKTRFEFENALKILNEGIQKNKNTIEKTTDSLGTKRSYLEGTRLGEKAIQLSEEHHSRAGIWFLYLLSRGYPEDKAKQLAISFKK